MQQGSIYFVPRTIDSTYGTVWYRSSMPRNSGMGETTSMLYCIRVNVIQWPTSAGRHACILVFVLLLVFVHCWKCNCTYLELRR